MIKEIDVWKEFERFKDTLYPIVKKDTVYIRHFYCVIKSNGDICFVHFTDFDKIPNYRELVNSDKLPKAYNCAALKPYQRMTFWVEDKGIDMGWSERQHKQFQIEQHKQLIKQMNPFYQRDYGYGQFGLQGDINYQSESNYNNQKAIKVDKIIQKDAKIEDDDFIPMNIQKPTKINYYE